MTWHRTIAGDELVLAKRLAGEEEGEQQAQEHPELAQTERLVLLAVADGNRGPEEIEKYVINARPSVGPPMTTTGMIVLILIKLREKEMVREEPTAGAPSRWKLGRAGREYLAARGIL